MSILLSESGHVLFAAPGVALLTGAVAPTGVIGATPFVQAPTIPAISSAQQSNPTLNATYTGSNPVLILVGVKQGLANGPDPQALTVTEGGNPLTLRGSTNPGQVLGNAPSWYAYYVQNPAGTGITASITGTLNPTDAMTIIPIEVPNATGIGVIVPGGDTSSPATSGSLPFSTTQDRSLAVAVFGARGVNTGANQFSQGAGWDEEVDSETGAANLDDFSFQVQSKEIDTQSGDISTSNWTEAGRWGGLLVEVLGTPGESLPQANPDTANAVTGGPAITVNVFANDTGGNLSFQGAPSIGSGGGTIDTFLSNGDITFTPPAADGVTVINYTAQNGAGSSPSTLTITSSSTPSNVVQFPSGAVLEWPSGADVEFPS